MTGLRWSWPTPRRLGTVDEPPSLVVFQDALRTRFVGNWCRVMQTGEHSKPVLQPGAGGYPPAPDLEGPFPPTLLIHQEGSGSPDELSAIRIRQKHRRSMRR